MNPHIVQLFGRLESSDISESNHAVAELAMLLDRAFERPGIDEQLCETILPEELFNLNLSSDDGRVICWEIVQSLTSGTIVRSTKISLFWLAMKMTGFEFADELLQFFAKHAHTFSEQEAFSSLAGLRIYFLKTQSHKSQLYDLIKRHDIVITIQKLQPERSDRLKEYIAAILVELQKLGQL